MELQIVKKKYGGFISDCCVASCELARYVRRVIRYTQKSEGAKLELLYSFPGIYAMEICFFRAKIRLIKEGDVFRVPDRGEKIKSLLSVRIVDRSALLRLIEGKVSLNEMIAEGRAIYQGSTAYFAGFTRLCGEGDRTILSTRRYNKVY